LVPNKNLFDSNKLFI